jgi:hypothetical protein
MTRPSQLQTMGSFDRQAAQVALGLLYDRLSPPHLRQKTLAPSDVTLLLTTLLFPHPASLLPQLSDLPRHFPYQTL